MIDGAAEARTWPAGTSLGRVTHEPITRVEIAWYLVASYDRNPIHVDEPFAQAAGFPSVIGQGMIPLGYLAGQLSREVGVRALRGIGADFVGPIFPGDQLVTEATLQFCNEAEGGVELLWQLSAHVADEPRLRGWARTFHEETR